MQAKTEEVVHLELPAVPTSIKRARDAVGALAERLGAGAADVKLAVSEAVTNAVVHAFRDRSPGTVTVDAGVKRGRLLIVVTDDGMGMRPNADSNGLGLGLSLITSLSGDARFDSGDQGVTVSMTFPMSAGAKG
jgi:serine/threonine-protein kinase RsbW/stage II sporulation protein AB (anti-sigma F factor)